MRVRLSIIVCLGISLISYFVFTHVSYLRTVTAQTQTENVFQILWNNGVRTVQSGKAYPLGGGLTVTFTAVLDGGGKIDMVFDSRDGIIFAQASSGEDATVDIKFNRKVEIAKAYANDNDPECWEEGMVFYVNGNRYNFPDQRDFVNGQCVGKGRDFVTSSRAINEQATQAHMTSDDSWHFALDIRAGSAPVPTPTPTRRITATPTRIPTNTPTRRPNVTPTPTRNVTNTPTPTRRVTPTPPTCVPSAVLNLTPATSSGSAGSSTRFTAKLTNLVTCGRPVRVDFSSSNTNKVSVSPASDSASPYQVFATATSDPTKTGTVFITANVYVGGSLVDSDASRFVLVPAIAPSCNFELLPASASVPISQSIDYIVSNVAVQNGSIDRVEFSIDDPLVASINPFIDSTATYRTSATGLQAGGKATITADMFVGGSLFPVCSDTADLDISSIVSWWQTKEADAVTNGDITSIIPASCTTSPRCTSALITQDSGESPGIAGASGTINTGSGAVSESSPPYGWQAITAYSGKNYSYDYFEAKRCGTFRDFANPTIRRIANLTSGSQSNGYYWVRYTGNAPLTITNDLNIGGRKIVLFVKNAGLNINGKINVDDGTGFFMAVVSGDIAVDPSVGGPQENQPAPDLEGIFLTNKQFITGTNGPGNDQQLHVRGSVVAFDKIVLERDLTDNTATPAELFEYGPDSILSMPDCLGETNVQWHEIAP